MRRALCLLALGLCAGPARAATVPAPEGDRTFGAALGFAFPTGLAKDAATPGPTVAVDYRRGINGWWAGQGSVETFLFGRKHGLKYYASAMTVSTLYKPEFGPYFGFQPYGTIGLSYNFTSIDYGAGSKSVSGTGLLLGVGALRSAAASPWQLETLFGYRTFPNVGTTGVNCLELQLVARYRL